MEFKIKDTYIFTIATIIIGIIIVTSLFTMQREMRTEVNELGETYLSDMSIEINHNIEYESRSLVSYIKSVAGFFDKYESFVSEESLNQLESIVLESKFNNIWIGGIDGRVHNIKNEEKNIVKTEYFKKAISGEAGITSLDENLLYDEKSFIVYAPIVDEENKPRGIIVAICTHEQLKWHSDSTFFGDNGYFGMIGEDGESIFESYNEIIKLDNYKDYFSSVTFLDGYKYDDMKKDIENNKKGYIEYVEENHEYCAYYNKIDNKDWYTFIVVPKEAINVYFEDIKRNTDRTIEFISIAVIIFMGILFYFGRDFRKKITEINEELDLEKDRFKIAISNSKHLVIEYDIEKNTFTYFGDGFERFGFYHKSLIDIDILKNGDFILKDYHKNLEKMIDEIKNGEKYSSSTQKVKTVDGSIVWIRLSFTNIFNERGVPIRAIGTLQDITKDKEREFKYLKEEQQNKAIMQDIKATYIIDITNKEIRFNDSKDVSEKEKIYSNVDELIKKEILDRIMSDDYNKVKKIFDFSNLKMNFIKQEYIFKEEYRLLSDNGRICWNSIMITLITDPEVNSLLGYIYIRDITKEKEAELKLRNKAERDVLTGIYNREKVEEVVRELLKNIGNKTHAFLMIDLDGFKQINDTYGHMVGDEVLHEIGERIPRILNDDDIFGRIGGDEFILFLTDIKSKRVVFGKANEIRKIVKNLNCLKNFEVKISVSIGIVMIPINGTDYKGIYKKADEALYEAKSLGKDQSVFYKENILI